MKVTLFLKNFSQEKVKSTYVSKVLLSKMYCSLAIRWHVTQKFDSLSATSAVL